MLMHIDSVVYFVNVLDSPFHLFYLILLDIGPIADDASSLPQPSVSQSSRPLSEEQLDGILSPELDKMVTDGKIFTLHLGFLKDMSKYDFQSFLHAILRLDLLS